jgi:D-sedoheptulose 7-phosphate isomerase
MNSLARLRLKDSLSSIEKMATSETVIESLARAAELIVRSYENDGCLFVAGNGGSAADAQHLVAEFVSKLGRDREPLRAFALTVDTSILTAVGNDYGFQRVFSRQVRGVMRPQDILLAITTSGNSPNIVDALAACRDIGCKTILFSGESGGCCKADADVAVLVPSSNTPNIQECHVVLYHILCEMVETELSQKGLCCFL